MVLYNDDNNNDNFKSFAEPRILTKCFRLEKFLYALILCWKILHGCQHLVSHSIVSLSTSYAL